MTIEINDFLAKHPVFTTQEFVSRKSGANKDGLRNYDTQSVLLSYHKQQGRLLQIKRGLYSRVPYGTNASNYRIDPYLLAGKITDDSVLSYHAALSFYGIAYSLWTKFTYLTHHTKTRTLDFQGNTFLPVAYPQKLLVSHNQGFGIIQEERQGIDIRVTSRERTLVDVLDRPDLSGGWEEIWRSFEAVDYLNLNMVIKYALLLNNATTIAKVGFFLEQHREKFTVTDKDLNKLKKHLPQSPHYMDKRVKDFSVFASKWNLMIPKQVIERSWDELQ